MTTILYARVSTLEQTIEHQRAHAESAGFVIDDVVSDNGVSGVNTRLAERPEGKRLFDKLRAGDVLVVRWVDRLGRNYDDVCETIRAFMARGVVIRTVINGMTFDGATTDPVQKAVRDALIGFMAATAQATGRSDQSESARWNRARQGPCGLAVPWPQAGIHAEAIRDSPRPARQGHVEHRRDRQGDRREAPHRVPSQG
jgi:putative DNA-invertase from lambdoid prophage Rac